MEIQVVELLGLENGIQRKRISLMNPLKENVLAKAQSYFTKDEKKTAKLNYKRNN